MPLPLFPTAEPFLPKALSLRSLKLASKSCQGCPLYKPATQTVFGTGPSAAPLMFIGEQPADQEDLAGKPFVGPSGHLLDTVLAKVGIDRKSIYVTNAVKHFKFEPRGKRRIHRKPVSREINACKPWLTAELQVVHPYLIVPLGATAAQSLLGSNFKVTQSRGVPIRNTQWAPCIIATVHPSSLLRIPDPKLRAQSLAQFEADLRAVKKELDRHR
jgi:DNA polymerase